MLLKLGLALIGRFCDHNGEVAASVARQGAHAVLRFSYNHQSLQVFFVVLHSKQPPCLSTQNNEHVHQNLEAWFRAAPRIACTASCQLVSASSQRQQLPTRHPKVRGQALPGGASIAELPTGLKKQCFKSTQHRTGLMAAGPPGLQNRPSKHCPPLHEGPLGMSTLPSQLGQTA